MTDAPSPISSDGSVDPAMSYTDAGRELDDIVGRLEAGRLDVDEVVAAVARASALIDFCRDKVHGAQAQVRDITAKVTAAAS